MAETSKVEEVASKEGWVVITPSCELEDMMYGSTDRRPPRKTRHNVAPMQCNCCGAVNPLAKLGAPASLSFPWILDHLSIAADDDYHRGLVQDHITDCLVKINR